MLNGVPAVAFAGTPTVKCVAAPVVPARPAPVARKRKRERSSRERSGSFMKWGVREPGTLRCRWFMRVGADAARGRGFPVDRMGKALRSERRCGQWQCRGQNQGGTHRRRGKVELEVERDLRARFLPRPEAPGRSPPTRPEVAFHPR